MSPEEGYTLAAEGALESLVAQFSSRLDCFRELVQNAIDAGSRRIDVWLTWEPGPGGVGLSAIHVDDDGEGMTADIIDHELTRLFASSKEHDLTKIGKFGIGFASIFALGPRAVLVQTGRQGEAWEVVFHEDRSYSRTPLPVAWEGTRVTLWVPGDAPRHAELVAGAREALWRWCRFTPVELWFQDRAAGGAAERVSAPFAAEGECPIAVRAPGMELALAWSEAPTYGFYNRGLTLLETRDALEAAHARAASFRRVSFRARADRLEHTLSRETVYRDEALEQVLAALEDAVRGPLADALGAELGRLASLPAPTRPPSDARSACWASWPRPHPRCGGGSPACPSSARTTARRAASRSCGPRPGGARCRSARSARPWRVRSAPRGASACSRGPRDRCAGSSSVTSSSGSARARWAR